MTIQTPATARIRRSPAARVHAFTKMAHHEANAVQIGSERPAAYAPFTASGSLLVHKDGAPHTISHFVLAYERPAGLAATLRIQLRSRSARRVTPRIARPRSLGIQVSLVAQPSLEV